MSERGEAGIPPSPFSGSSIPEPSRARDPHDVERALLGWLPSRIGSGATDVRVGNFEYPVGAGASNETVLFEATWNECGEDRCAELVLRVHPDQNQMFLETYFREQFELLSVLHDHQLVKVPQPLWFEDDPSLLGQPFFVMSRLRGRVPVSRPVYNGSGWLVDATPAQRHTVWRSAFTELTRIHAVPPGLVKFLDRPELGGTGLEQLLTYWERSIPWSTGGCHPPFFLEVAQWLRDHVPADHADGLSWGDARMGNMMFGDDYRLVGVMDWEQASLAGGAFDLGWWLFFDDFHSVDHGLPRLDGLGNRQETLELWQELVGTPAPDTRWYEIFAGYAVSQLSLRTLVMYGGKPTDDDLVASGFYGRTCDLLGWPRATPR
jgi:aminoglycoside phosphotransferase (APT) family kinase protein